MMGKKRRDAAPKEPAAACDRTKKRDCSRLFPFSFWFRGPLCPKIPCRRLFFGSRTQEAALCGLSRLPTLFFALFLCRTSFFSWRSRSLLLPAPLLSFFFFPSSSLVHFRSRSSWVGARARSPAMARGPDLPPEIWDLIAGHCDRASAATLAATCAALRAIVMRRVTLTWVAARAAMDAAVDCWERKAPPWDVAWTEPAAAAWCDACSDPERCAGAPYAPRPRQWICDDGVPGDARARNVCDACVMRTMITVPESERAVWPMRRVELGRPHVWSADRYGEVVDVLPSERVPTGRFVVPPPAAYLIDPLAPSTIKRWARQDHVEVLFRGGLAPGSLPSVRAWLPLAGAQHVVLYDETTVRHDVMRLALVCCDVASAMWGAVLLVDHTMSERTAVWALAVESLSDLLRRYRDRPAPDAHMGLVAWLYRAVARV